MDDDLLREMIRTGKLKPGKDGRLFTIPKGGVVGNNGETLIAYNENTVLGKRILDELEYNGAMDQFDWARDMNKYVENWERREMVRQRYNYTADSKLKVSWLFLKMVEAGTGINMTDAVIYNYGATLTRRPNITVWEGGERIAKETVKGYGYGGKSAAMKSFVYGAVAVLGEWFWRAIGPELEYFGFERPDNVGFESKTNWWEEDDDDDDAEITITTVD